MVQVVVPEAGNQQRDEGCDPGPLEGPQAPRTASGPPFQGQAAVGAQVLEARGVLLAQGRQAVLVQDLGHRLPVVPGHAPENEAAAPGQGDPDPAPALHLDPLHRIVGELDPEGSGPAPRAELEKDHAAVGEHHRPAPAHDPPLPEGEAPGRGQEVHPLPAPERVANLPVHPLQELEVPPGGAPLPPLGLPKHGGEAIDAVSAGNGEEVLEALGLIDDG